MSQKPLSILISGAGIAGSSLAMMLARHPSFNPKPIVTLIERATTPRTTGQAIDVRGAGVEVIRHLGLESKVRAKHTTETGIGIIGSKGQIIGQFDATGDADKQAFTTSEFEILRGELAELLLDEVEDAKTNQGANVNIVYGESISSLKEEDDGVAVEFSKGFLEAQKFDVVVAADGVGSITRSMMFDQYKSSEDIVKPWGWYIAFFTIPRMEHDNDLWKWYNVPGGLAIHIRPHRSKKTMGVYLSVMSSKWERNPEIDKVLAQDVAAQKAMMKERFNGIGWEAERVLAAMDQADDFYMQVVAQVTTPQWSQGRCALVGDSAYAITGMGTSYAMIGAYLIAGELAKVKSNNTEEIVAALKRHEDIFRPLVEKNQRPPPGFPQLANPQTKLGLGVLHTAVRFASWTKLDKLMAGWGSTKKEEWSLPDYGYSSAAAVQENTAA